MKKMKILLAIKKDSSNSKLNKENNKIETIENLINPIKENVNVTYDFFDYDIEKNHIIESALISKISFFEPDIFFFDLSQIEENLLVLIRSKFKNLKICAIAHECFGHYYEYVNKEKYIDNMILHELNPLYWLNFTEKKIFHPQIVFNKSSYYYRNEYPNKIYDFYYSGSISKSRNIVNKLKLKLESKLKGNFLVMGGRYENIQTVNEHENKLLKSKISLNFVYPKADRYFDKYQNYFEEKTSWSGKIQSIITAKCLMISEKSNEIDYFFKDGVNYFSFQNSNDIFDKISYFLKNENERREICDENYKKFQELFSDKNFYNICYNILEGKKNIYPLKSFKNFNYYYKDKLIYKILYQLALLRKKLRQIKKNILNF
jgi:hypothetical protein